MGKTYKDSRGRLYRVMPGRINYDYKGRVQRPDVPGWFGIRSLPWQSSPAEAEKDLAEYAQRNKLIEVTMKNG